MRGRACGSTDRKYTKVTLRMRESAALMYAGPPWVTEASRQHSKMSIVCSNL